MEKKVIRDYVVTLLHEKPNTQVAEIMDYVVKKIKYDINGDIKMLVNEVIWDLIIERAITPGSNEHNLNFPFLRVTNPKNL